VTAGPLASRESAGADRVPARTYVACPRTAPATTASPSVADRTSRAHAGRVHAHQAPPTDRPLMPARNGRAGFSARIDPRSRGSARARPGYVQDILTCALKKRPKGSVGRGNTCASPTCVQLNSPYALADTTASSIAPRIATSAVGPLPPPSKSITLELAGADATPSTDTKATVAASVAPVRRPTERSEIDTSSPFCWRCDRTRDTDTPTERFSAKPPISAAGSRPDHKPVRDRLAATAPVSPKPGPADGATSVALSRRTIREA
jgi:hypothetical protein